MQSVGAKEGEKVELSCQITANPQPEIKWFKNDQQLAENENLKLTYENNESKLVIPAPTAADKGTYKCEATNLAGTKVSTATIDIKQKKKAVKKESVEQIKPEQPEKVEPIIAAEEPKQATLVSEVEKQEIADKKAEKKSPQVLNKEVVDQLKQDKVENTEQMDKKQAEKVAKVQVEKEAVKDKPVETKAPQVLNKEQVGEVAQPEEKLGSIETKLPLKTAKVEEASKEVSEKSFDTKAPQVLNKELVDQITADSQDKLNELDNKQTQKTAKVVEVKDQVLEKKADSKKTSVLNKESVEEVAQVPHEKADLMDNKQPTKTASLVDAEKEVKVEEKADAKKAQVLNKEIEGEIAQGPQENVEIIESKLPSKMAKVEEVEQKVVTDKSIDTKAPQILNKEQLEDVPVQSQEKIDEIENKQPTKTANIVDAEKEVVVEEIADTLKAQILNKELVGVVEQSPEETLEQIEAKLPLKTPEVKEVEKQEVSETSTGEKTPQILNKELVGQLTTESQEKLEEIDVKLPLKTPELKEVEKQEVSDKTTDTKAPQILNKESVDQLTSESQEKLDEIETKLPSKTAKIEEVEKHEVSDKPSDIKTPQVLNKELVGDIPQLDEEKLDIIETKFPLKTPELKEVEKQQVSETSTDEKTPQILNKELVDTVHQEPEEKLDLIETKLPSKTADVKEVEEQVVTDKSQDNKAPQILNKESVGQLTTESQEKLEDIETKLPLKTPELKEVEKQEVSDKLTDAKVPQILNKEHVDQLVPEAPEKLEELETKLPSKTPTVLDAEETSVDSKVDSKTTQVLSKEVVGRLEPEANEKLDTIESKQPTKTANIVDAEKEVVVEEIADTLKAQILNKELVDVVEQSPEEKLEQIEAKLPQKSANVADVEKVEVDDKANLVSTQILNKELVDQLSGVSEEKTDALDTKKATKTVKFVDVEEEKVENKADAKKASILNKELVEQLSQEEDKISEISETQPKKSAKLVEIETDETTENTVDMKSTQVLNKEQIDQLAQVAQEKTDNLDTKQPTKTANVVDAEKVIDVDEQAEKKSAQILNKELVGQLGDQTPEKTDQIDTIQAKKGAKVVEVEQDAETDKLAEKMAPKILNKEVIDQLKSDSQVELIDNKITEKTAKLVQVEKESDAEKTADSKQPQILNKEFVEQIVRESPEKTSELETIQPKKSAKLVEVEKEADADKVADAKSTKILNKELVDQILRESPEKVGVLDEVQPKKSAKIVDVESETGVDRKAGVSSLQVLNKELVDQLDETQEKIEVLDTKQTSKQANIVDVNKQIEVDQKVDAKSTQILNKELVDEFARESPEKLATLETVQPKKSVKIVDVDMAQLEKVDAKSAQVFNKELVQVSQDDQQDKVDVLEIHEPKKTAKIAQVSSESEQRVNTSMPQIITDSSRALSAEALDSSYLKIDKVDDEDLSISNDAILDLIDEINNSDLSKQTFQDQEEYDDTVVSKEKPAVDQYGNFIWGSKQTVGKDKSPSQESYDIKEEDSYLYVDKKRDDSGEQQVPKVETSLDKESHPPVFTQTLTNQEYVESENVHLDCFVEGQQPILIRWYQNDKLIQPSLDKNVEIYRELGVCSMEIISATKTYQGEYKCTASNEYGNDTTNCVLKYKETSKRSKLEEGDELEFIEPLKDQVVELKSEVFLDCCVKNIRKTDSIEWYFNHFLIQQSMDNNIEIFSELGVCSLQIRRMRPNLQGFYSCKVRDVEGFIVAETGCYLTLEEPPVIISLTKDLSKLTYFSVLPLFVNELNSVTNLKEGERMSLLCRINDDCEPKPVILWFKDGKNITEDKGYTITYVPKTGECRLVVEKCSKMLNQGSYVCTAAVPGYLNDFIAKTNTKVRISVHEDSPSDSSSDEKSSIVDQLSRGIAPMFLQSLEDAELEEGDDLELKCQIMGAPIPDITCYFTKDITEKTGIKKIRSEHVNYNFETGICRINLRGVGKTANEGFYMVKAINDAGSLTTVCNVKINFKSYPVLSLDEECAPRFLVELMPEIKVMDGQEVCLTCVCGASPEPEIRWLRSSYENLDEFVPVTFTNDVKSTFDKSTGKCMLKITDTYPQDSGVFVCVASNIHGQATTRSHLFVECKYFNWFNSHGS